MLLRREHSWPWHELFRLERLTLDPQAILVSAELVGIEAAPPPPPQESVSLSPELGTVVELTSSLRLYLTD